MYRFNGLFRDPRKHKPAWTGEIRLDTSHFLPLLGYSTKMNEDITLTRRNVTHAVNRKISYIESAYSHNCEKVIGQIYEKAWLRGYKRRQFFVSSKVPMIGYEGHLASKFMKLSRRNLGVQEMDACFVEGPVGLQGKDLNDVCPVNEKGECILDEGSDFIRVWRTMEDQFLLNHTNFIGLCNFNIDQINTICQWARFPPHMVQMDINVYNMRKEERRILREWRIKIIATHIFGSPTFIPTKDRPVLRKHPTVMKLASDHGVVANVILVKFLTQQNIVCMLPGCSRDEQDQIYANITKFQLSYEEMVMLNKLDTEGAARLMDFPDYKGCQAHPEFPFRYDVLTDGFTHDLWERPPPGSFKFRGRKTKFFKGWKKWNLGPLARPVDEEEDDDTSSKTMTLREAKKTAPSLSNANINEWPQLDIGDEDTRGNTWFIRKQTTSYDA